MRGVRYACVAVGAVGQSVRGDRITTGGAPHPLFSLAGVVASAGRRGVEVLGTTSPNTWRKITTIGDRSGLHTMSDPTAPEPPRGWKGSGRYGQPIPGEIPGGPKPIVWRGMVLNSKVRTLAKD